MKYVKLIALLISSVVLMVLVVSGFEAGNISGSVVLYGCIVVFNIYFIVLFINYRRKKILRKKSQIKLISLVPTLLVLLVVVLVQFLADLMYKHILQINWEGLFFILVVVLAYSWQLIHDLRRS